MKLFHRSLTIKTLVVVVTALVLVLHTSSIYAAQARGTPTARPAPVQRPEQPAQPTAQPPAQPPASPGIAARAATTQPRPTAPPGGAAPAPAQRPTAPAAQPAPGPRPQASVQARAAATGNVVAPAAPRILASAADNQILGNPCREEYWGCMDMFCMESNSNGARCICSNDFVELNRKYNELMEQFESELRAANALGDQLEFGEFSLLEQSNRIALGEQECAEDDIACHIGAARFNRAAALCTEMVSEECRNYYQMNRLQYVQNIRNDCAAFSRAIEHQRTQGAAAVAVARRTARDIALEQHEAANVMNASECGIALRRHMQSPDICGPDWSRCVMRGLERHMAERILNQCAAVADAVWNDFYNDMNRTVLAAARLRNEADRSRNCLRTVVDCVHNACRDNIGGMGETMDACLARPEMVQSFCRIELEDCAHITGLWDFTRQSLRAMRVDRCTQEVRECFARDDACGADFTRCVGMDLAALHRMCPTDRLVVCREARPNFQLSDISDMILGIMLAIDNSMMDHCHGLVEDRLFEICGYTAKCENIADRNIGANALRIDTVNGRAVINGTVGWAAVDVSPGDDWRNCVARGEPDCDRFPRAGIITSDGYIAAITAGNISEEERAAAELVRAEIQSVATRTAALISRIDHDPEIGFCISGRDLTHITTAGGQTEARFPFITDSARIMIANAMLSRAAENQSRRLNELRLEAQEMAGGPTACTILNDGPPPVMVTQNVQRGLFGRVRSVSQTVTPLPMPPFEVVCQ